MHNMKRQILLVAFAGTAAFAFADTDLEKEFVEAIKSGRPLAAEAAFKRLSEERRDIAPIRYFQAAEIARQMGRETLRRVSTPQAYRFGKLDRAYHEAFEKEIGIYGSSYANTMMVELGERLYFAAGSDKNIKLTTPDDLEMFKAYLAKDRDRWQR